MQSKETMNNHNNKKIQGDESGDPSKKSLETNAENTQLEDLRKQLELCSEKLELSKKEGKEHYDNYLRAWAEIDNVRKRSAKEKNEAIRYSLENFLTDLLPVLDSFDKALEVDSKVEIEYESFKNGVFLVKKQFTEVLTKHGLEPVIAEGKKFNPSLHQAISRIQSLDTQEEIVSLEYAKGYTFHDRLLRPSMVQVKVPAN